MYMDDLGFESFNARIHVCRSSYALIGQKYPTDGPPLAEVGRVSRDHRWVLCDLRELCAGAHRSW